MGRVIKKSSSEAKRITAMFPRGDTEWGMWNGIPTVYCREGYDEIGFDIRPFPYMETPANRGMMIPLKELFHKQFMYCVTGWEGLLDENEEPLPCTPENKEWIFNNDPQLRNFVVSEISQMEEIRGVALKNS